MIIIGTWLSLRKTLDSLAPADGIRCESRSLRIPEQTEESSGRDQYVYMAKLAEQAERYEEMVQFMERNP